MFLQFGGVIIYWRSVKFPGILWRAVVRSKFRLQSVLVVSEIQRWNLLQLLWNFLLKFYHSQFVVLDGRIWDHSCNLFLENSWMLSIFLVTRFLNSSLLISISWYLWAIFGDHFEDYEELYLYALWLILWDSLYLCFVLVEYLPSCGFFYLYWEVFPTLIIGVDLFFCFQLHIDFFWIDWLRSGCFHIVLIKVNLIASAA